MKEFTKIFLVLCGIVGAFFIGRNFGEQSTNESTEIKTLKSENFQNRSAQIELNNLKEKFQKLLDSADLKKAHEVMAQVMTIFLADLSLHLSDQQQKDFNVGRMACAPTPSNTNAKIAKEDEDVPIEKENKKEEKTDSVQFKNDEQKILNLESNSEILSYIKKLELKKIDNLLDGAPQSTYQQSQKFLGSYRGSIIDVTGKMYATLLIELQSTPAEKLPLKVNVKLYKDGEERSGGSFDSTGFGYAPINSSATVFHLGSSSYMQLYKMDTVQKIAGIFYERLPNGTSKVIGTFVLSRTDFAD